MREDIRDWAEAAGHPEQAAELLDLLADVQTVHTRWRRRLRGGHAAIQEDIGRRTQAAKRIRNAEIALIPGLLQTSGYARSLITQVSAVYGTNDIDAAVQARMRRQDVLYDRSKVFEFVITEAALRLLPCPPQVMLGQLDRLMSLGPGQRDAGNHPVRHRVAADSVQRLPAARRRPDSRDVGGKG